MLQAIPSPPAGRRPAGFRRPSATAFVAAAVAAAVLPNAPAAADDLSAAAAKSNNELYRKSIGDAAVKRPSFQLKLKPIDASQSRVR